MLYNFNGKNVRINDSWLEKTMKSLELTREETIQLFLEDEGYIINEEQEELNRRAKGITRTIHGAGGKPVPGEKKMTPKKQRTVKGNPTKERVIAIIAEALSGQVEQLTVVNKSKLISFAIEGDMFEIDLKQKRKPQKNKGWDKSSS